LLAIGQPVAVIPPEPEPEPTFPTGESVALHSYPDTTVAEDPSRFDHSNTQFANAQADTLDPASPNFGKWIDNIGLGPQVPRAVTRRQHEL
jgi:hypothetical protein